jgi:hypothetical protein
MHKNFAIETLPYYDFAAFHFFGGATVGYHLNALFGIGVGFGLVAFTFFLASCLRQCGHPKLLQLATELI